MRKILVAGVGNVFLGDDGFGVEVARRLSTLSLPPGVQVIDFGIRAMHLAYHLMDNPVDLLLLVDATPRGGQPGSVYLIEPDLDGAASVPGDAHQITPDAVFATLRALGGTLGRVRIVGCEPASVQEGMELSAPVSAAIDEAVRLILEVIALELQSPPVPG